MKFQVRRQLTLVLENEPGVLARTCRAVADAGINIEALELIDSAESGVLRIVTSDSGRCRDVLAGVGLHVVEAEVIELYTPSVPGVLHEVARALAAAEVNVGYAYGSEVEAGSTMTLFLKVSNVEKACRVLGGLDLG